MYITPPVPHLMRIVNLFMDAGVNMNATSDFGCTALHFACRKSNVEIACLLMEYVNVEAKDGYDNLPYVYLYSNKVKLASMIKNRIEQHQLIFDNRCLSLGWWQLWNFKVMIL